VSTSGGLLRHEASQARVSQFCHKTGEGATAGGAHGIIVEVSCPPPLKKHNFQQHFNFWRHFIFESPNIRIFSVQQKKEPPKKFIFDGKITTKNNIILGGHHRK
jgi:hypothetical protein